MDTTVIGKTLLSQYQIDEFISATPLGDLYRATDKRSNKYLALTLLSDTIVANAEIVKELESKSGKLQAVSHRNISKYIGLFQTSAYAFFLEEWVDGPTLKDILEEAPIPATEALIYIKSICSALDVLHRQGVLHLNLVPELIRINRKGEVIVCGIGNALLLNKNTVLTLAKYPATHTSPEQLENQRLTPAADIYSLAILLYQLTTGQWINGKAVPKTGEAIRRAHLEVTPPPPIALNKEIPDHFSRMILWALRKNPDDRLKSTTELLSSLALAAQVTVDEIPPRANPLTAPVTTAILSEWQFLPEPKATILSNDTLPLDERLANLAAPKKKKSRIGFMPVFITLFIGGFISLFWFVRPVETPLPTPVQVTLAASVYTPPPTDTPVPRPTLPYGGRIVFTCTRGEYNQLCIINRDGSGLAQITDMTASNYYPVFTIDGGSILFASNRNGSFDLFLQNFSERQVVQVTNNIGNVISPDYSPDGRVIVFANRAGDGPTAIWMVNADGLNPRLVYTGAKDIVAVAWSPDGEKIAYAMAGETPQEYQIYVMDSNGRNHLKVSQGLQGIGGSVDWSPDGNYLLVHAGPFGDKNVFRIEAATGSFAQLTDGGNNAGASYSPDGQYIVFNSLRNNNQADLYIMRADGTNQIQITNDPEPDWGANWIE